MILQIGCMAHILALTLIVMKKTPSIVVSLTCAGLVCSICIFLKYYLLALPLMPMHLGVIGITMGISIVWCSRFFLKINYIQDSESAVLQLCIILLLVVSIVFPKNFYLPFLRSYAIWSHLFFLFGVVGRTLLLCGALLPLATIFRQAKDSHIRTDQLATPVNFIIWGYGFLALSMFSGEIWSYLGWGTPVVWEDPAIPTTIGLWFYWTCFLHLHYMKNWSVQRRTVFMAVGGLLVLVLSVHPDMGPFRLPHFSG